MMKNMAILQLVLAVILIISAGTVTFTSICRGEWASLVWGAITIICSGLLKKAIEELKTTD